VITRLARWYFGGQAIAGGLWWVGVFSSDGLRRSTLGSLSAGWLAGPDLLLFVGASAVAAVTGRRGWAAVAAGWTVLVAAALVGYATVTGEAGWGALLMVAAAAGSVGAGATLWLGRLPIDLLLVGPVGFRVAPARSDRSNVAHSLSQLVFFWTTFLIALPLFLTWLESRWRIRWPRLADDPLSAPGIVVFVVGSAIGLWSCLTMATLGRGTPLPSVSARVLVVAGPYGLVRNPMAVAGALQTIGVGLWAGSWTVILSALVGGALWHGLIRPAEEADLLSRFGEDYLRYRRRVRCWIPGGAPPISEHTGG
jgi:protein-S-isoprenylcysteine O-methyltransferase Ste14